ncbi:MAG: MATE family efflux transporter [Proteobacteria bacterium]|nr:MATE family efflux transporter [Pseudomonadota bacterium]
MNEKKTGENFLEGSILKTMLSTGIAMIPATLAMSLFHIVDTYFVGKLGLEALAAMGFCFPIVNFISCIYHSISTAVMTLLSHALGRKDEEDAARVVLHGIIFMLIIAIVLGFAGALLCRPLFGLWVETPEVLDYVVQFMVIWFLGNFSISLCMCGHKLVLSLGYAKAAANWMLLGLVLNAILEPIFIFGFGIIPPLEMYGAAIATVIAQSVTPIGCLYIINKRLNLWSKRTNIGLHWRENVTRITKYSIPVLLGMIIMPVAGFIMTSMAQHFGDNVVAAMSCISRIETLAFVVPMSIGMALVPMFAQNYGAKQFERIDKIRKMAQSFALVFLLIVAVLYTIFAQNLIGIFTDDPEVLSIGAFGLIVICWGYAAQEVHRFGTFLYNGCNRPGPSAFFNIIKIFVFMVPLCALCLVFDDVNWIFYGRLIGEILAAIMLVYFSRRLVKRLIAGTEK